MLSFLYVYSDHSILECYNLFSGVELSMRSFFVITDEITTNELISDREQLNEEETSVPIKIQELNLNDKMNETEKQMMLRMKILAST